MKITKRQLKQIIRETCSRSLIESGYAPDESFFEFLADAAGEAANQANWNDEHGPAAKRVYLGMIKDERKAQLKQGVDRKQLTQMVNDVWRQVYR